jgi:hypothetical protein
MTNVTALMLEELYEQLHSFKSIIFWDITPCSPLKVNRRFGGTSPPSSGSNKPSKICSSETSVDFRRNTRRCIPDDSTLHNHRCENLKSYVVFMEVICSSETSVEFRRTTRRYIPEDSTIHNYRCGNLKS